VSRANVLIRRRVWGVIRPGGISHQASSRTLLLTLVEEDELVEIDGLSAGSAAAGPAAQDGL